MARSDVRLVRNEGEISKMYNGIGYGLLNLGHFIQAEYQGSFQQGSGPLPRPRSRPGEPPAAQTGNLRRSAHTVVWAKGGLLGGGDSPFTGEKVGELGVIVGTNTGYGLILEVGSSKMAARPALVPAAIKGQQIAEKLLTDGARAHYSP